MRHPRPDSIRLKPLHRRIFYIVLALLFVSGAAWAYVQYLIPSPNESELSSKSTALKIHGAAAMATLVLIGTILTTHVRFAWRARRNRGNGIIFMSVFAVLIVTGYGLYYAGDERLRAWTSWIHLAVGLALPAIVVLHVMLGRRTRRAIDRRSQNPHAAAAKIDIERGAPTA